MRMCRKFMLFAVSPVVMFLTLVQTSSAMAMAKLVITTDTSTLTTYAPHDLRIENDHVTISPLLLQLTTAQQTTVTVPTGAIRLPQLGPSTAATNTAAITQTGTASTTLTSSETATATITPTDTATLVDALAEPLTTVQVLTPTTEVASPATPATAEPTDEAVDDTALDAAYALPIEGTIIANRTDANIRFFVEGATYELTAERSIGLDLPRVTAVLNLYNCDAQTPESTEGCFWDPYLLDRDGFYEIVTGGEGGSASSLTLQPAGSPPINQVWIQNRTGNRESIFFEDQEVTLPPASIEEFPTAAGVPAIFYLRSCLELPDRTVCEWSPAEADPEIYYALEESTIAGNLPNSQIVSLTLRPILSKDGETIQAPPQVNCTLQVPVLNVRSGPGLEYQIVAKIRGTDQEPGRVTATGRDELGDWLTVDDRIAEGGWITASANFIQCGGDVNALPIAEVTDGRLAPTPEPVAIPAPAVENANETADATTDDVTGAEGEAAEGEGEEATAEPATPAPLSIPPGLALIIVNNGFDQQMRFTLDQIFRVESGPSEFDLQPGESVSILVYPGQIAFSASSPWRGLSGNADFFIEDESRTLWITFVPDPDGSGRWILQY